MSCSVVRKLIALNRFVWLRRARCKMERKPYGFFFDEDVEDEAKAYCQECPVRQECLVYTLLEVDQGQPVNFRFGVAGGMNPQERWDYEQQQSRSN
jgi:hypothetical protein